MSTRQEEAPKNGEAVLHHYTRQGYNKREAVFNLLLDLKLYCDTATYESEIGSGPIGFERELKLAKQQYKAIRG